MSEFGWKMEIKCSTGEAFDLITCKESIFVFWVVHVRCVIRIYTFYHQITDPRMYECRPLSTNFITLNRFNCFANWLQISKPHAQYSCSSAHKRFIPIERITQLQTCYSINQLNHQYISYCAAFVHSSHRSIILWQTSDNLNYGFSWCGLTTIDLNVLTRQNHTNVIQTMEQINPPQIYTPHNIQRFQKLI